MGRKAKSTKPKLDKFAVVTREDDGKLYARLDRLVDRYHNDLREARIALAWAHDVKADKDGHLTLGRCKIVTPLDRQFHEHDIVIILNWDAWQQVERDEWRDAVLDHELCHALPVEDRNGEHKTDAKGKPLFRARKHDVEDFTEILQRHGPWKGDLEKFIRAGAEKLKPPEPTLFDAAPGAAPPADRRVETNPGEAHRGFAHVYTPKEGKALTPEGAREKIDKYHSATNDGARRAVEGALREAGWVRPGMESVRREIARDEARDQDRKTASAGVG